MSTHSQKVVLGTWAESSRVWCTHSTCHAVSIETIIVMFHSVGLFECMVLVESVVALDDEVREEYSKSRMKWA